jgi:hypothetical protein
MQALYSEGVALQEDIYQQHEVAWDSNRQQLLEPFFIGMNGLQTFIMSIYKIYHHRKKMHKLFDTLNLNIYQEAQRSNYSPLYHKIERIKIAQ